jgi:septal ring factor EnvC (AmiA/AmiB activator)
VMQGDTLATQSGAIVTAPADGSILYAGPFRSYGQLLILDAGDGYHIVLAGMGRISVAAGQSVIAGEPVGAMGEARVASASASGDANRTPELYMEFRKDGKPVDPAPWWSVRLSGRTGNDS